MFPSEAENFPTVLLEAMSAGMAVVTSTAGGCPEVVGDAGLLVAPGDVEGIRSVVTKLIEDVTSLAVDTPSTAQREAETVVSMNSGSTVVIGGLIRDDKITIEKKVPLIGDIPLIGGLFKFRKDQLQKTNLLFFITPHIAVSQEDLEQITRDKKKEIGSALQDFEQNNEQE